MATQFSKEMEEMSGLDAQGRLDISIFYGEDTYWWVSEAEKIFSRNQMSEAEKIEAATACFGWQTWDWFQKVDQQPPVQTWRELKGLMLGKFLPSQDSMKQRIEELKPNIQRDMAAIMKELDLMIKKLGGRKRSSRNEAGMSQLTPNDCQNKGGKIDLMMRKMDGQERESETTDNSPEAAISKAPLPENLTRHTGKPEISPKTNKVEESVVSWGSWEETIIRKNQKLIEILPSSLPKEKRSEMERISTSRLNLEKRNEWKVLDWADLDFGWEVGQQEEDLNEYLKQAQLCFGPSRIKTNSSSPLISCSPRSFLRLKSDTCAEAFLLWSSGMGFIVKMTQVIEDKNQVGMAAQDSSGPKYTMLATLQNQWASKETTIFPTKIVTMEDPTISTTNTFLTPTLRTRWIWKPGVLIDSHPPHSF